MRHAVQGYAVRRLNWSSMELHVLAVVGLLLSLRLCGRPVAGQVIGGPGGNRREDFAPQITEHPQSVIVPRGGPTTLRCRADGKPEPTITWLKDGERLELVPGDGHRSMLNPGELFFLRVIHSKGSNADVGTYQCVASNYLGDAYSHNATLEVTYIRDDFRREPSPTEAEAGDPVVLECEPPRGYPEPTVTWSKDSEDVLVDGDRVKVLQDGNLMISQSRATDAGNYVCTASNQNGQRSTAPVYLTVKAPPELILPVQDMVVAPGTTVVIGCQVIGDPVPQVTWAKEIGDLPTGRYSQQDDNSLRLHQVTQDDEGVYICTATNENGDIRDEMTLTVSVVPTFTQAPVDRTVELHHTASFQCQATGSPPPTVFWKKEGSQEKLLFIGLENGRFEMTMDGTLHITDVMEEDEGYYVCSAQSGSSMAEARAFLRVIASVSQPPPIISYGPSNQTLIVGTVALLTCEAAGSPVPSVRWTKDGAPLQASDRFTVLDTGRLQISGLFLDDSGMYSCIATNSSGQTSWKAYLRVIERSEASDIPVLQAPNVHELPASPGQPVGTNITRTSLNLRWLPPSRSSPPLSPVTHYRLEYFSHEVASEWQIVPSLCPRETCLVQQLRPGTTYLFLVRAVNDRGIGPPSPISQPITTRDDMSAIPSEQTTLIEEKLAETRVAITNVMVLSQTAVKVLWEVRQHREFVEGYHLKYHAAAGSNGFTLQTVLGSTNKIITGLEPNTDYTITVQPFNSRFNGPESNARSITTLRQGDALLQSSIDNPVLQGKLDTCGISIVSTEAIGSTSLKITWRVSKNEPYIDGYHIRYRVRDNGNVLIETVTGSSSKVLTGLTPWTLYAVSVQPFNGLYLGPQSAYYDTRTGSDVPKGAPVNVRVVSNGSAAILVSWQPPSASSVQGVIAGYYVYCQGNSTALHKNITADGDQRSVRVAGLMIGKVYKVMVAAFTTAGSGPYSTSQPVYITSGAGSIGIIDDDEGAVMEDNGSIVTQPWFIASLAVFFLLVLLCITVFVWRRHVQYKLAGAISKGPISRDNAAATHNMGIASSTQFIPSNHSSVQSSLQRGQGWVNPAQRPLPCTAGLLSDSSDHHGNRGCIPVGSATSSLNRAEYLQPNNAAYWLLEANDGDSGTIRRYDTQQMADGRICHQYPSNHSCYGSGGPVYAVVDNADDEDEEADMMMHGPHSALTLPMPRCPEHIIKDKLTATSSLPPHVTEPYASTTLIMPANMTEMRPPCSHSGSSEQSAASSQNTARMDSRQRRPGADVGPYGSGTGPAPQGERSSRKKHHRGGSKQPARNWTELLPPPPEQPPTDIDSPTGPVCPAPPCSHAAHNHMDQGRERGSRKKAPTPPLRQCCSSPPVLGPDKQQPVPGMSQRPQPPNYLHNKLSNNRGGTPPEHMQQSHTEVPDRPAMESCNSQRGVPYLASKRLFEDPRHEQLGKELLEFNDDMSQSEMLSDTDDLVAVAPTAGNVRQGHPNQATYEYLPETNQHGHIPHREVDTDMESAGSCTDAMLGSWSSMNGSSSSNRHSSVSESSDGSFFTDADFASAVAAAAQNSGMQVVGSTVSHPKAGKKQGRHVSNHRHGNPNDQLHQGPASGSKPLHHSNVSTFKPMLPPSHPSHPSNDPNHLVLQDTNNTGLTVTANPLAFAMEDADM